jgi:hypothetical protein
MRNNNGFSFPVLTKQRLQRAYIIAITLVVCLFGTATTRVFAVDSPCPDGITPNQCAALYGPWVYWDPDSKLSGVSCSSDGTLTGADNIQKIFNYFVSKGLSAAGAAGILGNMSAETGGRFDPTAEQNPGAWEDLSSLNINEGGKGGVGLVQWDGGRRPAVITYLKSKGLTDADFHTASDKLLVNELDYVMKELNESYTSTLAAMKSATDPKQAAFIFHKEYEGSADSYDQILQNRANVAQQIYDKYGGGATGGASGGTASSCGSSPYVTLKSSSNPNGFVLYSQCDPQWGSNAFAHNNICGAGCGPTSMAMIISTLKDADITPDQTAALVTKFNDIGGPQNYYILGSMVGHLATKFGLKATHIGIDVNKINSTLQSGGLVITSGKGTLPFTDLGHYIVIRGVTADGQWMLGDPAHADANTKPWDPQAVIAAGMKDGTTYAVTK